MRISPMSSLGVVAVASLLSMGAVGLAANHPSRVPEPAPSTGLQAAWNRLVEEPGLLHSTVSAYAYNITRHKAVAAVHPDQRETPGSLTKLFTSAAALAELGPGFRYETSVVVPPSVEAGHSGPVYLVGGGDPWLEANGATNLGALAAQVARTVKTATQVVGVSSAFAPPTYGIGWPKDDLPENYASGTAALMAERSEIFVSVAAAAKLGDPPSVSLSFNSGLSAPSYFHIVNRATTGAAGSAPTLSVTRRLGTNDIVVSGSVPRRSGGASRPFGPWVLSVGNPPLFAAALFQRALRQDGVTFAAAPSVAPAAPSRGVTIARHLSPPLSRYLPIQNRYSINQMAENLYRALGMKTAGTGSLSASAAAVRAFTETAGVSSARVQVDGSGLSPLDEMSAREMVTLLTYAAGQPWFRGFRGSLMHLDHVASCGILCPPSWTYRLPTGADLWVKTGNLSNQWNYAGYARAANGDLIAFAVLDDGTPTVQNAYPGSPVDRMMEDVALVPDVPLPAGASSVSPVTSESMPAEIQPLVAEVAGHGTGTTLGVSVVNTATGAVVYQQNGNKLLRAGLLPRLVLADSALQYGPETLPGPTVAYTGSLEAGTLHGALVIDGAHDSNLTSGGLAALARAVAGAGIRMVAGSVEYRGGTTGFHSGRWPYDMPWNDFTKAWAPPASRLMVNRDVAAIRVQAGRTGGPASVTLSPSYAPVAIRNETVTEAGSQPSRLTVSAVFDSHTLVLSGQVSAGFSETIPVAPPDPGRYAAVAFVEALKAVGVAVQGGVGHETADPGGTVLATVHGPSTTAMVQEMLATPSVAPAESLEADLGSKLWPDIGRAIGTAPNYLVEPTGAALGNYLTPDGVSAMLARAYGVAREAGMVAWLRQPWITSSPEESALAAYVHEKGGAVYAVTVIRSGLLWDGRFTPGIGPGASGSPSGVDGPGASAPQTAPNGVGPRSTG